MLNGVGRRSDRFVLLIEDDAAVREAIAELLIADDYPVIAAANGGEAFELMERHGLPSLILLDLIMPVMAGWDFLNELQRRQNGVTPPVIAISAVPVAGQPPGLVAFVPKPFTYEQLMAVVGIYYDDQPLSQLPA